MKFQTPTAIFALSLFLVIASMAWAVPELNGEKISDADVAKAIAAVNGVASKGQGHEAAVAAMRELNQATIEQVPLLLAGMDQSNPVSRNWLRGAIEVAIARGGEFPNADVKSFFADASHSSFGRLFAFELLAERNPQWRDEIVSDLVDDPSLPLRAIGVQNLIDDAGDAPLDRALGLLTLGLNKARDVTQIQTIVKSLAEKDVHIDVAAQLGFIRDWQLVGPFDNTDEQGYNVAHGPETKLDDIDLKAKYTDKEGNDVEWMEHSTSKSTGVVDLNKVVGKHKSAIVYALAEFESDKDHPVDIRVGCINACKVWVNGELVMQREISHVGMMPDQFIEQSKLNKGTNAILIKVCQNDQKQPWAQDWMFQLRVSDEIGRAIKSKPADDDRGE